MADASILLLNFTLGAFAFFSPCGFPMLPAYVAYYLPRASSEERPSLARAVLRGLGGGLCAAAGALLVLGAIGGLAALLGGPFKQRVVLLDLVGGLIVLGLGILVLLGRGPSFKVPLSPSRKRSALGLVAFGALYAGVAASCVAPVFLGVLFLAFSAPTVLDGAIQVGAYAAGLASLLLVLTVLIATSQDAVVRAMRRVLPYVEKASGVVLVLVGLYLIGYWVRIEYLL